MATAPDMAAVGLDIKTQLAAKAPLASPTFTGTPKAPTAAKDNSSTQLATTAFVATAVADLDSRIATALDSLISDYGG